jgi:hypothetical protein
MVYRYVRYNGQGFTIYIYIYIFFFFYSMVKCVCCYMDLGFNCCFVSNIALTGDYYRMYIISGVGHPRSESIVPNRTTSVMDGSVHYPKH